MSLRLDRVALSSVMFAVCVMLGHASAAVPDAWVGTTSASDEFLARKPVGADVRSALSTTPNVTELAADVSGIVQFPSPLAEKSGATVALQYPTPNSAFSGADTTSIRLQAAVGAVGEQVLQVWFRFCEGAGATCTGPVTLVKTMVEPPYETSWVPPAVTSISNTARTYSYLVWAQAQFSASVVTSSMVPITFYEPQLPQVSLDAPDGSLGFVDRATVVLYASASAAATDPPSSIARLDFLDGDALIGTMASSNSSPSSYAFSWVRPSLGRHTVTARVTDSRGYTRVSNPLTIAVLQATAVPAVSITSPANGQGFTSSDAVDLAADVSAGVNTLAKVEFAIGTRVVATANSPPYEAKWFNPPPGTHALVARAYDDYEMRTVSAPVFIEVRERGRPPAVVLTAPGAAAVITGPATVSADAIAPDGTVTRVDFFAGTTLLGSASAPPYSVVWANPVQGPTSLTAKAYDSSGDSVASSPVNVSVAARAPRSVMTQPSDGAQFAAQATVDLAAEADEPGDTIAKVDFLIDDAIVGTSVVAPYIWSAHSLSSGRHRAAARATDSHGVASLSLPVVFTISAPVDIPPSVSMSSPLQAQIVAADQAINLVASATDPDGFIAKVEFFADGALLGSASSAPFTFLWNGASVGDHTVYARATDDAGAVAQSTGVSFSIRTALLDVTLPAEGTSIAADFVLVSGTYTAPANSGVTVNGIVAQNDGNGQFFVNNLPLSMGENTLTVTLTTEDGQSTSRVRTVTRTALAPLQVYAESDSQLAPGRFTIMFADRSGSGLSSVDIRDLNGATVETSGLDPGTLARLTFGSSGVFTPTFILTDSAGNVYSQQLSLLAQDRSSVDRVLKISWSKFVTALAAGDTAAAAAKLSVGAQGSYLPTFQALATDMPAIIASLSSPETGLISTGIAEIAVSRRVDDVDRVYLIYFLKDANGVWRLDSM